MNTEIKGVLTLTGTSIGVGILGIPYVIAKTGIIYGTIILILVMLLSIYINILYFNIIKKQRKIHHLPGYTEKYLGKTAGQIIAFSDLTMFYFVEIAYMFAIGSILNNLFGVSQYITGILFFLIITLIINLKFNRIIYSESVFSLILVISLIILSIIVMPSISIKNFSYTNIKNIFIPFGILVFAFYSLPLVPEIYKLTKDKKSLILSGLLVGGLYLLFTVSMIGLSGAEVMEISVLSLGKLKLIGILIALFGIISSSIPILLTVKDILLFDYKLKIKTINILSTMLVLILFTIFYKINGTFTFLLKIVGSLFCSLQFLTVIILSYILTKKRKFSNCLLKIIAFITILVASILAMII